MNVQLSDMKIRGNATNERDLGFEANASSSITRSRRSGRKMTMNQAIATPQTKVVKLSAADFFFRKGGGGSQSDDEGNAFSDDEDVAWASGHSKRSLNSVIAPKISKIDDDDMDFFSEAETDSESVSKKEKKKKSKDKEPKDKKKSKDKKSKKKKSKDKKKQKHGNNNEEDDLSERSESDSVNRSPMDPDGVKLSGGLSASPMRKPKKSVISMSKDKTKDESVTHKSKSSKSEKKNCKSTKIPRRSSDKSKEKACKSSKRSAEKSERPKTPKSSKRGAEKSKEEKSPKSSNHLIEKEEKEYKAHKRDKSSVVKSTDAIDSNDNGKVEEPCPSVVDFNTSFVDLSKDSANNASPEECPDTPIKHRRSTTETSKRGRRSLSRGRSESRLEATKQDDSILQSPEKSSTSSTERTSTTSKSSSWGDFEGMHRARTIEFPGDLIVSPDCAKKAKKSVGNAFELDSFADLQNSFTDFQSSSTEFNANFESEDAVMERAKEEAKRQMLDQSRKGPVRVRVSIRRRNKDPASPGSKPKPLKPITVPSSPSKKDESIGGAEPLKEEKAKCRPLLDGLFAVEPKSTPSRKNSSATIHGGGFSPANVDNFASFSSLPDIRKKKNTMSSPNAPNRGVLHREDSANRLRSTQDLAGVVDEFLRSGRQPTLEESSDLANTRSPRSKSVSRRGPRRSSSGHSLLSPENQALDKTLSSIIKTPKRRSSTGKLLGAGKKADLTSPDTASKSKRRLSFGRSLSKFRQLGDEEK